MPFDTTPTVDDSPVRLQAKILAAENLSLGGSGIVVGAAFSGDAYAVQCLTECTFTTFTENNATGSFTGTAIPAGTTLLNPRGITAAYVGEGELIRVYLR